MPLFSDFADILGIFPAFSDSFDNKDPVPTSNKSPNLYSPHLILFNF